MTRQAALLLGEEAFVSFSKKGVRLETLSICKEYTMNFFRGGFRGRVREISILYQGC